MIGRKRLRQGYTARDTLAAAPRERQVVSGPLWADCVSYRVVQAALRTGAKTVEGGRWLGQLGRALAMAVCRTGGEGGAEIGRRGRSPWEVRERGKGRGSSSVGSALSGCCNGTARP
jgi:hypothetical protein